MEISQKPCISVAILKITRDQVQAHKETSSKKTVQHKLYYGLLVLNYLIALSSSFGTSL